MTDDPRRDEYLQLKLEGILNAPLLDEMATFEEAGVSGAGDARRIKALRAVPECKLYLFRGVSPLTEVLARALFEETSRRFGAAVERVRVWETPTQYAEFVPDSVAGEADGTAQVADNGGVASP